MKFCDRCGNLMRVKTVDDERILFCQSCGNKKPLTEIITLKSFHGKKEKKAIIVDEDAPSEFPMTQIMCPKCGEVRDAYWTMQQTRGGDEPPTRFYECRICHWRWREYS